MRTVYIKHMDYIIIDPNKFWVNDIYLQNVFNINLLKDINASLI